jgi:hypothetical protein
MACAAPPSDRAPARAEAAEWSHSTEVELLAVPGKIVAAHAIGDSLVGIVTARPAQYNVVRVTGGTPPSMSLITKSLRREPLRAAPCSRGGMVVIAQGSHEVLEISATGTVQEHPPLPIAVRTVHALQCESAADLVLLTDPVLKTITRPTLLRTQSILMRVSGDSSRVDTLGALPGRELLLLAPGDTGRVPPYGAELHAALGTFLFYVGTTDDPAIRHVQINGHPLGYTTFVVDETRIPPDTVRRTLRASLGGALDRMPAATKEELLYTLSEDRHPQPWVDLAADPDDNLWIGSTRAAAAGQRAWLVFDRTGHRIGRLHLPDSLEVLEVGRRHLLAARGRTVVWYDLRRGRSPTPAPRSPLATLPAAGDRSWPRSPGG